MSCWTKICIQFWFILNWNHMHLISASPSESEVWWIGFSGSYRGGRPGRPPPYGEDGKGLEGIMSRLMNWVLLLIHHTRQEPPPPLRFGKITDLAPPPFLDFLDVALIGLDTCAKCIQNPLCKQYSWVSVVSQLDVVCFYERKIALLQSQNYCLSWNLPMLATWSPYILIKDNTITHHEKVSPNKCITQINCNRKQVLKHWSPVVFG